MSDPRAESDSQAWRGHPRTRTPRRSHRPSRCPWSGASSLATWSVAQRPARCWWSRWTLQATCSVWKAWMTCSCPTRRKRRRDSRSTASRSFRRPRPELAEATTKSRGDYDYRFLLSRAIGQQPETHAKAVLPPPHTSTAGRRTCWRNFPAFCRAINRPPGHVSDFISTELCASCSCNAEGSLTLKSRVSNGQLQALCRSYVTKYTLCGTCKVLDTLLTRDNETRLTFVDCQVCGARRSVQPIRRAFVAKLRREPTGSCE